MPCWPVASGAGGIVPRLDVGIATAVGFAVTAVFLDQLAKLTVTARLGPSGSSHEVALVGRGIALRYVENTGAAFGLLRGQGVVLSVLAVTVLIVLVVSFRRIVGSSRIRAVAVGLVVGGAAGNLIDRARLGYVVDFVAVGSWPTFNVADSAISVGVVLLAYRLLVADASERAERGGLGAERLAARSTPPRDG